MKTYFASVGLPAGCWYEEPSAPKWGAARVASVTHQFQPMLTFSEGFSVLGDFAVKKLVTALALLLSSTAIAQPDKDWWACQYVAAAGMDWEDGKWSALKLAPKEPFILMSDGKGSLNKTALLKVFDLHSEDYITCITSTLGNRFVCVSDFAKSLYFNTATSQGGVSILFGAGSDSPDYRDTVGVLAFECTKG